VAGARPLATVRRLLDAGVVPVTWETYKRQRLPFRLERKREPACPECGTNRHVVIYHPGHVPPYLKAGAEHYATRHRCVACKTVFGRVLATRVRAS
jgi:hypothetical protein